MVQVASRELVEATGLEHKYSLSSEADAPLVYLVHGRAGTYDVMWTFRRCLPEVVHIVAPQAPNFDELGGYSWWDVSSGRKTSDAAEESVARLQQFMQIVPSRHNIRPHKTLALGFSQGAGLLSVLLQKAPQQFAGVGLLAGFVIPLEGPTKQSLPPVFMAHGSADDILPISKAREGAAHLEGLGFSVSFVEDQVGHKVGTTGMRALKEWVQRILA